MTTRMKIASGIATAALAAGSLGVAMGPANAAGDQGSDRVSSVQARQGNTDFNPTLEKVNFRQILVEADKINRKTTIKLLVDRAGNRRTVKVWNPNNSRPRDFAETVTLDRVGKIKKFTVRIVQRDFRGRVVQVQDSNDGGSRGGGGRDTGGGNAGGGNGGGLLGGLGGLGG